jgi:hypothetical protein
MEGSDMDVLNDKPLGNRRFFRISKKHKVLVQTCDADGVANGNFVEQALTSDYSQGGVRILVKREVPSDSLLLIDFGTDFIVPQLQGIVQMCWSRKLEDSSQGVEAGFAFKDPFSQAVLASQMSS